MRLNDEKNELFKIKKRERKKEIIKRLKDKLKKT